ncbi:MAG TPA: homocysteine S-methyltransferase family protein, partial [Minicystis sp.]|nr:homocysteine S-methyltransferase family protein [Minicystis sp.]
MSARGLTLLDGAMGTELVARGVPTPDGAWSAAAIDAAPEVVAAIHAAYAAAGATVHTANTFRTRRRQVGPAWQRLARRAVEIARASVPAGHRVAGSVGPVEDCYRPDRSPGRGAFAEHAELARALADAGADVLLCETFPRAEEACAAVRACVATGLETWVALTAGPTASLLSPADVARAAREAVALGAAAVLVDCTAATRTLAYVEAHARARLGVPIGAYANAGAAGEGLGWGAPREDAARRYAALAGTWIEAGASIVGG